MAANRKVDGSEHKRFWWIYARMKNVSKYSMVVFICLFFIIAVFEIVFVLARQRVDAAIKAFADTTDLYCECILESDSGKNFIKASAIFMIHKDTLYQDILSVRLGRIWYIYEVDRMAVFCVFIYDGFTAFERIRR